MLPAKHQPPAAIWLTLLHWQLEATGLDQLVPSQEEGHLGGLLLLQPPLMQMLTSQTISKVQYVI